MHKLGTDIWDSEEMKFDKNTLQVLLDHITGKENATMDDVEALFNGKPIYTNARTEEASGEGDLNGTYHQEYSSKVVKSDLLNRNANKITPGIGDNDKSKGLCVTLKGKEFRVTSLTRTLPAAANPDGDIVATLLLKDAEISKQWNIDCGKSCTNVEPSNMYGTSYIRKAIIGKEGWLDTFIGNDKNFAAKYLIKPQNIGYQREQRIARCWQGQYAYSLPNDALDDVGGFYSGYDYNDNTISYDYYNNGGTEGSAEQIAKRKAYIAWGEDYAWLPSVLEIGNHDYNCGIWNLQWLYAECETTRHNWLRSGNECDHDYVYGINNSSIDNIIKVDYVYKSKFGCCDKGVTMLNGSGSLRPAIHLNLSAAVYDRNEQFNNVDFGTEIKQPKTIKKGELWNENEHKFDIQNIYEFINCLTGKTKATMHDVAALFSGVPIGCTPALQGPQLIRTSGTYYLEFSSKVVKCDLLHNNAMVIAPKFCDNRGYYVTLKGKEFYVTSLTKTLPTEENPYGDIVATLLLKKPECETQWSTHDSRIYASDEPSNMYGTSYIRRRALQAWLSVFVGQDDNFAIDYLVQPKLIGYQHEQCLLKKNIFGFDYNMPNEALDDVGGFHYDYYNNGGEKGADSTAQLIKREKYISWGNDYAWLPSFTEMIGNGKCANNIWGMSAKRGSFGKSNYVWLRSGRGANYRSALHLKSSGVNGSSNSTVTKRHGLRPALHLNLSAATNYWETAIDTNRNKLTTILSHKKNEELWNANENIFNADKMKKFISHLTGKQNAEYADLEVLFRSSPIYINSESQRDSLEVNAKGSYHLEYNSKVVKSNQINENAYKISPEKKGKGLTVTLKGKEFRVTSLTRTLPTDDNPDGDIVATLLLKSTDKNVQFNNPVNINCVDEPPNMYGISSIRRKILPAWLVEFMGADQDFAVNYLVPPKHIGYQHRESLDTRWKTCLSKYCFPNDALDNVGNYMDEGSDYYNNGDEAKRKKYISWGDDYVWLPSSTEIGCKARTDSIWGMPIPHISYDYQPELGKWSWLRSGNACSYIVAYMLSPSGVNGQDEVTAKAGLRPAMHLNLSAINRILNEKSEK